jgi:CubicO group peptidase (beta-lactamase class C family)
MQLPLATDELYLPVVMLDGAVIGPAATATAVTHPDPPDAVGRAPVVDDAALEAAVAYAQGAGSRALLVTLAGQPLLTRFFGADDERSLLPAGLVSRPVSAMAMGLALAEGKIASLDLPVENWLSEWDGEPRGRVTVRQLLEDTSGLETGLDTRGLLRRSPWNELARLPSFATDKSVRLLLGNDHARTALRFELAHEPGGFHNPSPANVQLAAMILERASGQPFEEYVHARIWRPAGGGSVELALDRRGGMPAAHCCWRATGPDMARVLGLLANRGIADGRQVLPAGWAEEMARASRVNGGSGMQMARQLLGGVLALSGRDDDGNAFWVVPELQLVVINIVNEQGRSPPELAVSLLRALAPG